MPPDCQGDESDGMGDIGIDLPVGNSEFSKYITDEW